MLPIPFSFIWAFQILIGYSEFLRNAYLRVFFIRVFLYMLKLSIILQVFFSDTFTPECKLLSVSISKMSSSLKIEDTILNPGLTCLYQGQPINRGNSLIMQDIVPSKHRKCNH